MKSPRIDIGSIRREQIVEAAVAVIAERGLQHLSLSEIETKAGMSRGQLTYYFKTKEAILLAVFDRLLQLMYQRVQGSHRPEDCVHFSGWDLIGKLLATVPDSPQSNPEFHCLQYTFLSEMSHREDFRERLATLYEEWRGNMAKALAGDLARRPAQRPVSPRALATLVQAMLHGLAVQHAADPKSFATEEMMHLCVDVLGNYLWSQPEIAAAGHGTNGSGQSKASPRPRTKAKTLGVPTNGSTPNIKAKNTKKRTARSS